MADLNASIEGFVAGDDLEVRRTVTDLPAPISEAWITLKRHPRQADSEAAKQKHVTTTDVPGTGEVVVAGGPDEDGDLRFDFTATDTRDLGVRSFVYDIQIKLEDGKLYTLEKGIFRLTAGVTDTAD